jgi:penicillin V acylase-like amidase (Ntn superfamily)
MLNTTTAIRLMLDKAATVEEAVALLKDYNLYFSGDIQCHYLVADATGNAVVLEFWDNELKVVKAPDAYPAATNFVMYNGLNIGEGFTEFERYDAIQDRLAQTKGIISETDAMSLLGQVATPGRIQWSVVYNMKKLTASIAVRGDYSSIYDYSLAAG